MGDMSSPLCERVEPLAEQEQTKFALVGSTNSQPLPKPFKIDDLPQDIQDFLNKHGGIGLLVEKCMELNPQWVDTAMAWVFIIQWAREELGLSKTSNEDAVCDPELKSPL